MKKHGEFVLGGNSGGDGMVLDRQFVAEQRLEHHFHLIAVQNPGHFSAFDQGFFAFFHQINFVCNGF